MPTETPGEVDGPRTGGNSNGGGDIGGLTGFLNGIGENRSFCFIDSVESILCTDLSIGAFTASVRGEAGVAGLIFLRVGEGGERVTGRS